MPICPCSRQWRSRRPRQAKNKLEFDRANKNVGVLDGGSDAEDAEDLFGDKDEESKVVRKTKKLLARRGEDEGDSSEEEYVDSVRGGSGGENVALMLEPAG